MIKRMRGVAQFGSAPLWGSGGRGFKSRRSDYSFFRSVFIKDLYSLYELIPTAINVNDEKIIRTTKVRLDTSTSPNCMELKICIYLVKVNK